MKKTIGRLYLERDILKGKLKKVEQSIRRLKKQNKQFKKLKEENQGDG